MRCSVHVIEKFMVTFLSCTLITSKYRPILFVELTWLELLSIRFFIMTRDNKKSLLTFFSGCVSHFSVKLILIAVYFAAVLLNGTYLSPARSAADTAAGPASNLPNVTLQRKPIFRYGTSDEKYTARLNKRQLGTHAHTLTLMDCTVEIDGLLVIYESVDGRTAQFWKYRSWSSCHTARLRHMTAGLHTVLAGCTLAFESCNTCFFELVNRLVKAKLHCAVTTRHDTTCRQLPRNFPADLSATSLTSPRTCREQVRNLSPTSRRLPPKISKNIPQK